MKAIIFRIILQMKNDKRSLALILFAPILIMSFMYILLSTSNYIPKVVLQDLTPLMSESFNKADFIIVESNESNSVILKENIADAIISISNNELKIELLEPNGTISMKISQEISKLTKKESNISYIYGSQADSTFQSLSYVFLGIYSFLFVFIISGISFLRERTLDTMERFMLSPINRISVVFGFILGFGIFAVLQSIFLILYVKYVLGLIILGSLFNVMFIMVLLSFIAISLGSLVSVLANNEFQVIQFIPIVIVPQIFFSGLIPINTLPYHLDKIAVLMPIYHACNALKSIIIHGSGFLKIIDSILYLLIFIIVLFIANVFVLKKYRSI